MIDKELTSLAYVWKKILRPQKKKNQKTGKRYKEVIQKKQKYKILENRSHWTCFNASNQRHTD